MAGFHWDKYLSKGSEFKKKKLTDIGFIGFSWIKGPDSYREVLFQWIWIRD
jgi:hypothetical protein